MTAKHLMRHGLTTAAYREKHPAAVLSPPARSENLSAKLKGREITWKDKISEGTKRGMHASEAWEKFEEHVRTRDTSGFGSHFKSDLPETKAKVFTPERNAKVSKAKSEWWATRQDQTVEQLYGEETGKRFRQTRSEQTQGEKNPAFGKVYECSGGRSKIGRYKGGLFRGILEYCFYKQLESQGLLERAKYEPFRIPYEFNGRKRTYTPDFLVGDRLIEVKPKYIVEQGDPIFLAKKAAAETYCSFHGLRYELVTEDQLPRLSYKKAYADPDVEWIKR